LAAFAGPIGLIRRCAVRLRAVGAGRDDGRARTEVIEKPAKSLGGDKSWCANQTTTLSQPGESLPYDGDADR
jgi:hypothetical protein